MNNFAIKIFKFFLTLDKIFVLFIANIIGLYFLICLHIVLKFLSAARILILNNFFLFIY